MHETTAQFFVNSCAQFFLGFSHPPAILLMLALIFLKFKKSRFIHGLLLIVISIIINVTMKKIFAIPLKPHLMKEGFAFPSGHMQTATVLYGYVIMLFQRKIVTIAGLFILGGIGFGLVYEDYHTLIDVLAALFVARLILMIYFDTLEKLNFNKI